MLQTNGLASVEQDTKWQTVNIYRHSTHISRKNGHLLRYRIQQICTTRFKKYRDNLGKIERHVPI